MDLFLIILSGLFLLAGLLGTVLPVLPGVPLSYIGIILLHLTSKYQFSTEFLIVWAVIVVAVQLLDYLIPAWGTKKWGGSKFGVWGSTIGLIIGLFASPVGIILGPFLGALIGEFIAGKNSWQAMKSAFGAFAGFLIGTLLKLIVSGFLIYYYVDTLIA